MRYICLIYNSTDTDGTLTPDETNELIKAHFAFDEELLRDGIMIHSDALETPDKATVLRVRNNTLSATDGPYVETKEHIGGFWVLELPDMDAALDWGKRAAVACRAPVEVRAFGKLEERDKDR